MGFGIFLHHVICDVRIDNGEKESQVYRIFSKKEYEDVINKGFYMIETYLEKFWLIFNLYIKEKQKIGNIVNSIYCYCVYGKYFLYIY